MASLSGWVFVIIGGFVGVWSYFQESLLFFTVVGGAMVLYGISKIVIARAFKKNELTNPKPAVSGQRVNVQSQMETYVQQPRQQVHPSHQQAQMHAHNQHRTVSPPQTHLPAHANNQTNTGHRVHQQMPIQNAHLHQPQIAYKVCPNCKKHMHNTYRFCPNCGWGV